MNYIKKWLRWQLRLLASIVICALLIVSFAALGGKYWPEYAWGSTVIFTLLLILLAARLT
ncbi:hypothetical protein [Kosakonia cowanii]|uniref:hypothetical protein n=1 Tax=Kosakonia cowanii TaxID=208223 RepID=UPI00345B7EF0